MAAIITQNFKKVAAKEFLSSFAGQFPSNYYVTIGRDTAWDNELVPPTPTLDQDNILAAYNEIDAAKKLDVSQTRLMAKRFNWTSGVTYDQYDSVDSDLYQKQFYVLTEDFSVYKCIDNGREFGLYPSGKPSTVKPSGTLTDVFTTADGYRWKYMYTLSSDSIYNYLIDDFIPCKTLLASDGSQQFTVQQSAVPGTIDNIYVTDGGAGYATPGNVTVTISGDGTGATATANISGGIVRSITITNPGSDYTTATATISDSSGSPGSGAKLRVIISPLQGHGADPEQELFANYVLALIKLQGDETGTFPAGGYEFRQLTVIKNPLADSTSATLVKIIQNTGNEFREFKDGETLYRGLTNVGTVQYYFKATNDLYVTPAVGETISVADNLTGADSGVSGVVQSTQDTQEILRTTAVAGSSIQQYSGDMIYIDNRQAIIRNDTQNQLVRIVFEF